MDYGKQLFGVSLIFRNHSLIEGCLLLVNKSIHHIAFLHIHLSVDNKACFPPESFRLSASLLLSVSVPVSQVSVSANRSSCWSMMKSWRVVVLLQTDHGLSVQMHTLFACIMLDSIMAHCLRFVAFDPVASPIQIKSGLCSTIGTILCCKVVQWDIM